MHPTSGIARNLSKNTGRYVENTNKKVVFLWKICHDNHYGWVILLKFYWFLNSNSQEFIVDSFSYKAHFRPQISSNDWEPPYCSAQVILPAVFRKSSHVCSYTQGPFPHGTTSSHARFLSLYIDSTFTYIIFFSEPPAISWKSHKRSYFC